MNRRPIIRKKILSLILLSCALPMSNHYALANPEEQPVSFFEAWQAIGKENDALKAARAGVEQAQFSQEGVKGLYLPEVGISASYLYLDDAITLSPNDLFESMAAGDQARYLAGQFAQSYGVTATELNAGLTSTIAERDNATSSVRAKWPIYTGGRITAAQDIATGQVNEAEQNLRKQTLEQFENLVRYYFGVVLANQVYETRKEVEIGLRKHRDNAVLMEKEGQIARVERMQSEASLDKAIVESKKARGDLEIAKVALTRLLKSSDPVSPADPLFILDELPPISQFLEETLGTYPDLFILDAKKEQAEGLAVAEKGKYFPTVAVFGDYSLYEEDNLATKLKPEWVVGVGLNLPLLERSGRSGKHQAARSAIKRIDHLHVQARSDLTVLIEKTYRQAEQALDEYKGLRSSQQLAEETVALRVKAFSQGVSTSLDVVDAELFLAGVKTQRAIAVYNYVISLGRLVAVSSTHESFSNYQKNNGIEDF